MKAVSDKRRAQNALYKPIHDAVIERDGRCMAPIVWGNCDGDGWHVHHVISRARAPELALDPSNLTTLCPKHHRFAHDNVAIATACGVIRSAPVPALPKPDMSTHKGI